jgi:hypothetical protein
MHGHYHDCLAARVLMTDHPAARSWQPLLMPLALHRAPKLSGPVEIASTVVLLGNTNKCHMWHIFFSNVIPLVTWLKNSHMLQNQHCALIEHNRPWPVAVLPE